MMKAEDSAAYTPYGRGWQRAIKRHTKDWMLEHLTIACKERDRWAARARELEKDLNDLKNKEQASAGRAGKRKPRNGEAGAGRGAQAEKPCLARERSNTPQTAVPDRQDLSRL